MKWFNLRLIMPVILTIVFIIICYILLLTPEQSGRKKTPLTVPMVEAVALQRGDFDVSVRAQGLVKAAYRAVDLASQVSGKVIKVHSGFLPGGIISAGEVIMQIEPLDYQLAVNEAKARLVSAQSELLIEQGRQQIAEKDYIFGGGDVTSKDNRTALALRKPQLRQVVSQLDIAKINYEKAVLALQRTKLTMPYDVYVLESQATLGEVVSVGSVLGKLIRADSFWLELKVKPMHLHRLQTKSLTQNGALVKFSVHGKQYQGQVVSVRADLVSSTRLGGVIVEVINTQRQLPLVIGSYVEAQIQAGVIANALMIPRASFLSNNQIYIVDSDNKLQIRSVNVLWQLPDSLIIDVDVTAQERLVTSRVTGVVPGSTVDPINVMEIKPITEVAINDDAKGIHK